MNRLYCGHMTENQHHKVAYYTIIIHVFNKLINVKIVK